MKAWLVTGGCGFIGSNLAAYLKERGDSVRVLDNLSVGSREDLEAVVRGVELVGGDITDSKAVEKALDGIDRVVHLAAHTGVMPSLKDPLFDCQQNVTGTLTVLEAARRAEVESLVFASSGAPLGDQDPPLDEQKVPKPLSPYGASKLAGEAYCSAYHGSFGFNAVALRFSNAYGPYSFKKGSVVAEFFRRILAGKPLVVYGNGEQTRDFIHVRDLCQAMVKAAESKADGEVFQIATGEETSVNSLVQKIKSLVEPDKKVEVEHQPARIGEVLRSVADISKARRMLGFDPQVKLDQGLEETWQWFQSKGQGE